MPLPKGTRYRYKKGTKIRLAFSPGSNKVIEAKNMSTGDVAKMSDKSLHKKLKRFGRGKRRA